MLGYLSAVSHDCLVAGACLYTGTRELCEGGKERCRIKEEISSGAHQHFKRSKPHTHATTHISTGHGNVRVSVWQTHHQQAACSLIGHHCHYYWANHLACPLHTAPLCCSCFVFFPSIFFCLLYFPYSSLKVLCPQNKNCDNKWLNMFLI